MDYVAPAAPNHTIDWGPMKLIFGANALVICPTAKTITVGDGWAASDAADEVVRILAEHFGLEKV